MANIETKVAELLKSTIENLGYKLYDVIYEKEAQDYYLRVFIDQKEGISLNDCEKVNNAISDLLDEANYIKEAYFLEVSSPGIERLLRKDEHLQEVLNQEIILNLYKPIEMLNEQNHKKNVSKKQLIGILKEFNEEKIVLKIEESKITIQRKDISNMKLKYNWD
ncbi:MAG: ribosome maturation factor RimP [Clostridia bacterium]|nr:ribosome maturation factor RimP [Clostridia bacterium]